MSGDSTSPSETNTTLVQRLPGILVAVVAAILAGALFFGLQADSSRASLSAQADRSLPLAVALDNDRPTFLEFYADWCTSCQAMAPELASLRDDYGDAVNFVMLNVDNTKWLPELLRYRVDGIPHFVYLNREGEAIASAIGEQPRSVLAADLAALVATEPLPYAQVRQGKTSAVETKLKPSTGAESPRSHGTATPSSQRSPE